MTDNERSSLQSPNAKKTSLSTHEKLFMAGVVVAGILLLIALVLTVVQFVSMPA